MTEEEKKTAAEQKQREMEEMMRQAQESSGRNMPVYPTTARSMAAAGRS